MFVQVADPVGSDLSRLARPGGNATGITNTRSSLGGKWVELLREAAPGVTRVGYLFNRAAAPGGGAYYMDSLLSAADALGLKAVPLELRHQGEIDTVIADFAGAGGDGMVANSDSFITVYRHRIIAAANRLRLPTIYSSAIQADSGGLLSYGADTEQQWQAAASYVDRILRGEKPRTCGAAARQIRVNDQPQDCKGARRQILRQSALARRRSDRMKRRAILMLLGGAVGWSRIGNAQRAAPITRRRHGGDG